MGKGKERLVEPLFVREQIVKEGPNHEDCNMSNDIVLQKAVELTDAVLESKSIPFDDDVARNDEDLLDLATPQFESLKVSDDDTLTKTTSALKRKRVGEDVFTRQFVKTWQGSRIKAWESRYLVSWIAMKTR